MAMSSAPARQQQIVSIVFMVFMLVMVLMMRRQCAQGTASFFGGLDVADGGVREGK